MKTKINFSREAVCSLFLSIFTCLFTGFGLTNRNFTHLVEVLWSHQGVGTAVSQTSISSSPVVLALWGPRMKSCSWHSCSSTELKESEVQRVSHGPQTLRWHGRFMRWRGNSRHEALCGLQNVSAQPFLNSMCNTHSASTWCCHLLPCLLLAPSPFHPKERQVWLSTLTIRINHECKCLMSRFRVCWNAQPKVPKPPYSNHNFSLLTEISSS